MSREEERIYLIKYLINENKQYKDIVIPNEEYEQKQLLRSLFNVRPPHPISAEFLGVQDTYLQNEIEEKGIVDVGTFNPTKLNEKIYLWQGDITRLKVGAIVNACNSALLGCFEACHSCIDNIIHTLSGVQLRLACNEIMEKQGHLEETGVAKITKSFNLPCDYVVHTVGPIIRGKLTKNDEDLLASCYKSSLEICVGNGVKSVAFCCISTGVFHFPQDRACQIAVNTVLEFLKENNSIEKVIFNVFTEKDFYLYNQKLNSNNF